MEVISPHRVLWYPDGLGYRRGKYNDSVLLAPTLNDPVDRELLAETMVIWHDRGYDSDATRKLLTERSIVNVVTDKTKLSSTVR